MPGQDCSFIQNSNCRLWTHAWSVCHVNSSGSTEPKVETGVSCIHSTADGANTDCSKHRGAGGGVFVFRVHHWRWKQGKDSGQQHSLRFPLVRHHKQLLLERDMTSGALRTSRPRWGSVLCRKGFCRWEAAVGCVGVGRCSLRCFLLPSAHDSLSSAAQLFSNHESLRQTPFG